MAAGAAVVFGVVVGGGGGGVVGVLEVVEWGAGARGVFGGGGGGGGVVVAVAAVAVAQPAFRVELLRVGAGPVVGVAVRGDGDEVDKGAFGDDDAAVAGEGEGLSGLGAFGDGDDGRDEAELFVHHGSLDGDVCG